MSEKGNVLFNDTLNIFYSLLYGFRHMVKVHSDSREEKINMKYKIILCFHLLEMKYCLLFSVH